MLLKATFSSNVLISHDLQDLLSCLFNPTEYLLWEEAWNRSLKDLLPELLRAPDSAFDADDNPITYEHLCGEGEWIMVTKQVEKTPQSVLNLVKTAAQKAFITTPT